VARLSRTLIVAVPLLVASLALSSCGVGAGVADARASCVHVKKALALQARSADTGISSSESATLQASALNQLLRGTQDAANATTADGSWNALQTTISEAQRVPLGDLVPALTRLCNVADSTTPYL